MRRLVIGCAVAVVVLFGALPVLASRFSFYEQSAKASGQAGTWIALADDAAANWYNPAVLVRLEETLVPFGLNYLDVGSDAIQVRFGLLRDQNPVPNGTLRPSIPDADRTGYSVGYGFIGEEFQVDAHRMHLPFDTRNAAGVFAPLPGQPATPNDDVIDGTYRSSIDPFGVTAGLRF